jgi:hypothetical protein
VHFTWFALFWMVLIIFFPLCRILEVGSLFSSLLFGSIQLITTLTLGSWPRQGLARVWDKREAREVHLILPRVQESVRKWALTLPSELPLGELECRWTPKSSKSDCKGQNPLDGRVIYIIGKLLKRRCLKWVVLMDI